MPKNPWRCSQCGTVNEPAANSCRTCGRWPSLFDLQDSAVGDVPGAGPAESEYEVEEYEPEGDEREPYARADEPDAPRDAPAPRRGRSTARLVRLIIPVGVLVYLVIASYFSNR